MKETRWRTLLQRKRETCNTQTYAMFWNNKVFREVGTGHVHLDKAAEPDMIVIEMLAVLAILD